MANTPFKYIQHFIAEELEFDLYINSEGNYFVTSEDTKTKTKNGIYFSSREELNQMFKDKLNGKEITDTSDHAHAGTVGKPEALK